jgi:hypothetical protein
VVNGTEPSYSVKFPVACIIKKITTVRMTIVSDVPSCGVTYDRHSDGTYIPRVINYAPRVHF